MPQNRLDFIITAKGADEGLRKFRAIRGEMKDTERAANQNERAFDKLGDEAAETGRKVERMGGSFRKTARESNALERAARGATSRLIAIGGAAAAAGAGLATIGSVKITAAFESEFSKVETLLDRSSFAAGNFEENIDGLRVGLLNLRADSGDTFENLNKGLFDLVSAGVAASDSVRVLNDANTLAKAGVTDVSVAVDGLTTVINSYGLAAERSEIVASKFFTAQKFGKTTVEELARGIGRVASSAANFGIQLDELLAAQAAATAAGINQAEAFTGLRAVFGNLVQQEARAREEAERLGIEFSATAVRAKGLTKFLEEIQSSANFTEESFERLFRSTEALNFILAITGDTGSKIYAKTLAELSDEARSVATLQEAYAKVLDDSEQKTKRLIGTLESLAVAFGAGLAPSVDGVVEKLTEFLQSDDFEQRLRDVEQAAKDVGAGLQALADFIGGVAFSANLARTAILDFVGGLEGLEKTLDRAPLLGGPLGILNVADKLGDQINKVRELGKAMRELSEAEELYQKTLAAGSQQRVAKGVENFRTEFGSAPIGVFADPSIGDAQNAFSGLNKEMRDFVSISGDVVSASAAQAASQATLAQSAGTTERALRDQLAISERLLEAAKGGQVSFDAAKAAVELDELAVKAVEAAKKAGEDLSLETARFLVGRIDDLNSAAQALLDAEKALRERASAKADDIATDLENRIGVFVSEVGRADLTRSSVAQAFDQRLGRLIDDIDELSIGLNADQLEELYGELANAGVAFKTEIKEASDYGADRFRDALSGGVGDLLDDLIFNGGKGFSQLFEGFARNFANDNFIDPISDALSGKISFSEIGDAFNKSIDNFARAGADVAKNISSSLESAGRQVGQFLGTAFSAFSGFNIGKGLSGLLGITGNKSSQVAGGALGGLAGSVVGGPIGAVIGAGLGQILGGLFSKPSSNEAGSRARLDSLAVVDSFAKNQSPENIQDRNTVLEAALGAIGQIRDLTGGAFSELANLIVRVNDRDGIIVQGGGGQTRQFARDDLEGATRAAIELSIQLLHTGGDAIGQFAKQAIASGRAVEDVIPVLRALASASETGRKDLANYALAAANAGRSGEQIASGVQQLGAALDLAAPKLSDVEKAIASIDGATKPVIDDLKSLGLSIAGVSEAAQSAVRAVGTDFIRRITEDIERFQNSDLAEFRRILRAQAQDNTDAQLLLDRGGITQDEFRFVQQRNALEQAAFFEGLDQDALNELGDYLGLIRENGGEAAVTLLKFNQELDRTKERLTDGLSSMREEADRFFAAATANANLADDIRFRLSNETGVAQLATFRGELQGLLAQAQGPDRNAALNAAERAPDVARQFIQLAESRLGASAGLGQARDFVTDILDRISAASTGFGNETVSAIEFAEQQVGLLGDIKSALESPDPALDYLQSILANGELQSATLRDLLDQYVQLSYDSPSQNFTPGQVQQAASEVVLPSELRITSTVTTDSPSTTLAITTAAREAREDAQQQTETIAEMRKKIQDMSEAITKLDATLRRNAA